MRDFTSELLRCEIPRPLHPRPHGRAALVAAGSAPPSTNTPPTARPHILPTLGPAREVPAPPSARGVRTGLPRWLTLTYEDPDIGRGARPARPLGTPRPRAARLLDAPPRSVPGAGRRGRRPLPFSHPHPLGPDVGSTTARARSTRAALGAGRPLSPTHASTPCASRAPRNSPKNLKFFCHRRMPVAYIHVSGFARICAAPNKTRGIRRFGRRVRRVYFFSRPPCAYGGCVVYSWRL